jgi:fucose permease
MFMADSPAVATTQSVRLPVAYTRLMAASVVCMIMFGAVQVMAGVALRSLGDELGIDLSQQGFILSLRLATLTACLLVVGHFAEGPRKRYIFFWGLVATAAGQVLIAYAPAYGPLIFAVLVSGIGFGIVEAILNPLVAQLNPTRTAWALNLLNGIFSLGLVVGAVTTGELIQRGYGWRLAFWLWMIPPLICAVLYLTPRYPAPEVDSDDLSPKPDVRSFLRRPLFWLLVLGMIMAGGCESGLTLWAPSFCERALGASARNGAFATILYGTFMAIGRIGSGFAISRLGTMRLMGMSAVLCGVVTFGLVFVNTLWAAWALFAMGGLFVACFWPTILAIGSENIAPGSTSLFSLLGAAGVTGCFVFPWLIGALGDAFGLRHAVLVLPISMVLLIVVLILARPHTRHTH